MRRLSTRSARRGRGREDAFEEHWRGVYGERWPSLRAALLAPAQQVAWLNPFCTSGSEREAQPWASLRSAGRACVLAERRDAVPVAEGSSSLVLADQLLKEDYALDGASPLPALALDPRPGHRVLDLCAAPGGKSLVLAGLLFGASEDGAYGPPSVLVANDRSASRSARLRSVFAQFLPAELLQHARHDSDDADDSDDDSSRAGSRRGASQDSGALHCRV